MNVTTQKSRYKKYVVDSRLRYFKPHSTKITRTFAQEVSSGLRDVPRSIPPMFFYDLNGSDIFEEICALPEYYVTRTEVGILAGLQKDLPSYIDGPVRVVELGSGMSVKTRTILDAVAGMQEVVEYLPIDVSDILAESSEQLLRDYDCLSITGIIDTYEGGLEFLRDYGGKRNLILFLGSSFGNFSPEGGEKFLRDVGRMMRPGDLFMIGLDLVKDKKVLESAYDDSHGVTARFNLNMLSRINDELDADFDLQNFAHHSVYNEREQRIEMYLKSLLNQPVVISECGLKIDLRKGELIHTEYSHKFTLPQIRGLLEGAGFQVRRVWLDDDRYFSVTLASKLLPGAPES